MNVESKGLDCIFTGQYYDHETGDHYNWNSYYKPGIGRYITNDPIGLDGGLQTYGYAQQNSITTYDSLGYAPEIVGKYSGFNVLDSKLRRFDVTQNPDLSAESIEHYGLFKIEVDVKVSIGFKIFCSEYSTECGSKRLKRSWYPFSGMSGSASLTHIEPYNPIDYCGGGAKVYTLVKSALAAKAFGNAMDKILSGIRQTHGSMNAFANLCDS